MRVLCLVLLVIAHSINAQETSPFSKFGNITVDDLQKKLYSIDSNANAIVLSDIGQASIEGNSKGWFSIVFKRHRVVHVLNKNGYDQARVEIGLYAKDGLGEKLENIKAVTYNLQGGKIIESKLEKASVFREKANENFVRYKFVFPNVKEGCIIEYEYKVASDYIQNLDPWYFQGATPVLWSEYKLTLPQFFSYTFMGHGYHPMHISNRNDRTADFRVSKLQTAGTTQHYNFSAGVSDYRWVMKDVPALKEEGFTSSLKNHIARVEFQLSSQGYPLEARDYRNTWTGLTKELLSATYFGAALDDKNNWLRDEIKPLLITGDPDDKKAKTLFQFVRDNFICTNYDARYLSRPLKNVMQSRKGNVAEINLLLTAILRHAGLKADPVLLSTTDHGYALENYPLITVFNYVIVQCIVDGREIYLDASHPLLGFGKLLPECYNGHARVINEDASAVYFYADSLQERKMITLSVTPGENGKWMGICTKTYGMYESFLSRESIREIGKESFFEQLRNKYPENIRLLAPVIDSLHSYEQPMVLRYNLELDFGNDNVIYFNPLFIKRWESNPFKFPSRRYPVEMPFTIDETNVFTMAVPDGYFVDELPKQLIAKLDEDESTYYEYRIFQSGKTISVRSRLKISRTMFMPEEYENLREFFNLMVNKQNEQIVFKKKK